MHIITENAKKKKRRFINSSKTSSLPYVLLFNINNYVNDNVIIMVNV